MRLDAATCMARMSRHLDARPHSAGGGTARAAGTAGTAGTVAGAPNATTCYCCGSSAAHTRATDAATATSTTATLFDSDRLSDVCFTASDGTERIHAHRVILWGCSGYFRTLFESGLGDTRGGEMAHNGPCSFATFRACLEFM